MEEISTVSLLVMAVVLIVFALLYGRGKKKYKDYIEPLDKDEFTLKELLPMGFLIMELSNYQYNTALDRQNRKYLKELYDPEFSEFYLHVYWAQAVTYSALAIVLGAMVNLVLNDPVVGLAIGLGMGVLLPYVSLIDLKKKVEKRHLAIAVDMPELVNKIVILTGAGLTLQGALSKITKEMYSDRILYQELSRSMEMIEVGETADAAFDRMATKCNTVEMRRFLSIILQNIHRGGSDVSSALKSIGEELWNSRKAAALRVAEEASTKMLFPMMLMLFAVIMLVIVPAVQGMKM